MIIIDMTRLVFEVPQVEPEDARFYEREALVFLSFDGVFRLPTQDEILAEHERLHREFYSFMHPDVQEYMNFRMPPEAFEE